ncbi:MAG: FAD-dependent oxidoreductase [Pseudomonadales bacterium]|nr:FAD-dependent oxidoreductase [Pseudomonadales bacterium]
MNLHQDLLIFGGGIAGLWLLDRARQAGYSALLFERDALGAGQSIASQGMIHGGLKYALGGALTTASEAIADMPAHWRACLAGEGDVDLRGTRLLSEAYYLWPRQSLRSRLTAFLGSKTVRGKVQEVAADEWPAFFHGPQGTLYRLHDIVLDVPSLLATLAARQRECIHRLDPAACRFDSANPNTLILPDGARISAQRFIFTAGAGNETLITQLSLSQTLSLPQTLPLPQTAPSLMQRRPLQMVVVKHHYSEPLYVHCVSDQFSATPELTVTTHPCRDGRTAWYLGGELAETGARRSASEQTHAARALLTARFPWCEWQNAEFSSVYIDRAEARQRDGKRPDHASLLDIGPALCCWPTKLTLAPNLATRVLDHLRHTGITPRHVQAPRLPLPNVNIATPPWEL